LKKTFILLLTALFISTSTLSALDNDGDDIFKELSAKESDFDKIKNEPTKKDVNALVQNQLLAAKQQKLKLLRDAAAKKKSMEDSTSKQKSSVNDVKNRFTKNMESQKNSLYGKNNKKEDVTENKVTETQNNKKEVVKESNKSEVVKKTKPEEKIKLEEKSTVEEKPKSEEKIKIEEKSTVEEKPKIEKSSVEKTESVPTEKQIVEVEKQMNKTIDKRQTFIDYAMTLQGTPYVWGGKTPSKGLDCSGLISYSAKKSINYDLSGNAQTIYNKTTPIKLSEALPGDLVFFKSASDKRISHVGIFLGKNKGKNDFGDQYIFLNAASSGNRTGVIISGMNEPYWKKTFYGCGRFLPEM